MLCRPAHRLYSCREEILSLNLQEHSDLEFCPECGGASAMGFCVHDLAKKQRCAEGLPSEFHWAQWILLQSKHAFSSSVQMGLPAPIRKILQTFMQEASNLS